MAQHKHYSVDKNQKGLRQAAHDRGANTLACTNFGGGFPDLVLVYRGFTVLVEVKNGPGQLNPRQIN